MFYHKLKKILFFSNNLDKLHEVQSLFDNTIIKILSPLNLNVTIEPKENGRTFEENAKKKSFFGYKKTKIACFADDSGICIEALDWQPNIYSKKFLEKFKSKDDCLRYVIQKVKKSGRERAYFQTSICYTSKENYHVIFNGRVDGTISKEILGKHGFGYDPIFIPKGKRKTFGEMYPKKKYKIDHRYHAFKKIRKFL